MKIQEVLVKENVGKKFKWDNEIWTVVEDFRYIYEICLRNEENEDIDDWRPLFGIVQGDFVEIK